MSASRSLSPLHFGNAVSRIVSVDELPCRVKLTLLLETMVDVDVIP